MTELKDPGLSSPLWRLTVVTLCTGILAGLGGMMLALLLHFIQHLTFGYSPDFIISSESFLQGVSGSVACFTLCDKLAVKK